MQTRIPGTNELLLLLLLLGSRPLSGTMVAVAVVSNSIYFGADSKVLLSGARAGESIKLCKIGWNLSADTMFLMTGDPIRWMNLDGETYFDAWKIFSDSINVKGSLEQRIEKFRTAIVSALNGLRRADEAAFHKYKPGDVVMTVLVGSFEHSQPKVYRIAALLAPDHEGFETRFDDAAQGNKEFGVGNGPDRPSGLIDFGFFLKLGPVEGLRWWIQREINRNPSLIGPPISILRLDVNGPKWISQGKCESIGRLQVRQSGQ